MAQMKNLFQKKKNKIRKKKNNKKNLIHESKF